MKIAVVGVTPIQCLDPRRSVRDGSSWEFAGLDGGQETVVLRWKDARGTVLEIELERRESEIMFDDIRLHFEIVDIGQGVAERLQRMLGRSEN